LDTIQPYAPVARPRSSLPRRLIGLGIGAFLALGYWSVVAAMLVIGAVFILIVMGPAIIVGWLFLCACAWGLGLFLCVIAALLTIAPQLRRPAIAFLIGSAVANVVLVAGVVLLYLAIELISNLTS
jgi:hypothetical protein